MMLRLAVVQNLHGGGRMFVCVPSSVDVRGSGSRGRLEEVAGFEF